MDTLQRLHVLITLAKVDGHLSEKERNYIISIGLANHLLVAEILPLFTPGEGSEKDFLQSPQKEQVLLELIQLMQIDEKIYQSELQYCAKVASRLGFREAAVFEIILRARELSGNPSALSEALKRYQAA